MYVCIPFEVKRVAIVPVYCRATKDAACEHRHIHSNLRSCRRLARQQESGQCVFPVTEGFLIFSDHVLRGTGQSHTAKP